MIDWDIVWRDYIGITWSGAFGVIVSAIVLYVFFSLLVQVSGQRLMANPTVGSFVVLAVIGGVTARATLGEAPTLLGALLVLNTVMLLESSTGMLKRTTGLLPRAALRRPAVVMVEGKVITRALRRRRLSEQDLLHRLRIAGVRDRDDVELVILENRGTLTILRRGTAIDPELVAGIEGSEAIPERLLVKH